MYRHKINTGGIVKEEVDATQKKRLMKLEIKQEIKLESTVRNIERARFCVKQEGREKLNK